MIIDKLSNAHKYFKLSIDIKLALEYLSSTNLSSLKAGKYLLRGDEIYANVESYKTRDEIAAKFEAHKKYIDIQFLVKGEERIGWANIENFREEIIYNEQKDIMFGRIADGSLENYFILKEGYFVILMPEDAHKPSLNPTARQRDVKKVVVKIKSE